MRLDFRKCLKFAIFLGIGSQALGVRFCFYDKWFIAEGYTHDLYSVCMRLSCYGGRMSVSKCPNRRPPPGMVFGKYKYPHDDFPKCCERELKERNPYLKGGRFYTPAYYCCTTGFD